VLALVDNWSRHSCGARRSNTRSDNSYQQMGAFFLKRHRQACFSSPLSSPVWSAVFSSRNEFQRGTSRGHLGEFGLVMTLILLGFVKLPVRIKIAIDRKRSERENRFAALQSPPGPRYLHTIEPFAKGHVACCIYQRSHRKTEPHQHFHDMVELPPQR